MVILIWLLFEIILFFSISVINIILKSASYIERSILTYLITAIIYLIFIFFLKIKTVIKTKTTVKKYLSYILMGIGICLFHRVIFLLFPNIAISTFKNMGLEEYLQVQYSFRNPFIFLYICIIAVSYTHLTLPTIYSVHFSIYMYYRTYIRGVVL